MAKTAKSGTERKWIVSTIYGITKFLKGYGISCKYKDNGKAYLGFRSYERDKPSYEAVNPLLDDELVGPTPKENLASLLSHMKGERKTLTESLRKAKSDAAISDKAKRLTAVNKIIEDISSAIAGERISCKANERLERLADRVNALLCENRRRPPFRALAYDANGTQLAFFDTAKDKDQRERADVIGEHPIVWESLAEDLSDYDCLRIADRYLDDEIRYQALRYGEGKAFMVWERLADYIKPIKRAMAMLERKMREIAEKEKAEEAERAEREKRKKGKRGQ